MTGSVLIVTWDGGGNVGPAIALGQRLRQRGNDVRLMGWESLRSRTAAAGLKFSTYLSVPPWPADLAHEDGWAAIEAALGGEATTEDIRRVAAADPPDLIVYDCMMTAADAAVRELDVRSVALVHVLYQPFVHEWGNDVLKTDVLTMLDRADLVLATSPPGFDFPAPIPANTHYVGAITAPLSAGATALDGLDLRQLREPGDPWVLISLGTTLQRQHVAVPVILEALAELPVRVLLTTADLPLLNGLALPKNALRRGFAPHEQLLPYVELVVCHGGLSTVSTALAFGVPMVCLPQGREQPLNANRLTQVGAGITLGASAGLDAIRAAASEALVSPAVRAAAQGFAHPNPGARAADLVEKLLA